MTRIKYMPGHWGMHGFNRDPSLRVVNVSINLQDVEEMAEGKSINLSELGFDKLLGKGKMNKALNITVNEASSLAIKKVEAAGGSVILGDSEEWEEE
jgi:large subunit ribosomal protein L15